MSLRELQKRLDTLPFRQRQAALFAFGRTSAPSVVATALEALSLGAPWQRSMAMTVAAAACHWPTIERGLTDPSAWVRDVAVDGLRYFEVMGLTVVEAALASPRETRRRIATALHTRGDAALCVSMALACLEADDVRAARPVLAWCDEGRIDEVYASKGLSAIPLRAVATRHPALVLRWLLARLRETVTDDEVKAVWAQFSSAHEALSKKYGQSVLAAWEQHGPWSGFALGDKAAWRELLPAHETKLVQLVCRSLRYGQLGGVPNGVVKRFRRLAADSRVALLQAVSTSPEALEVLLRQLAPSARQVAFTQALAHRNTANTSWPVSLLALLPHRLRHAEAQRMMNLPEAQRHEAVRLTVAPSLPLAEALKAAQLQLAAPTGEARASGWRVWTEAVRLNRQGLDELVAALARLKNEQDPVRAAACEGLASLPPGALGESHLAAVAGLAQNVAEARDTSHATRAALARVAQRMLVSAAQRPSSAVFQGARDVLLRMAGHTRVLSLPSDWQLPLALATQVVDGLVP